MVHKHRCESCKTVWEHERDASVGEELYNKAHDCPNCGENQRSVYFSNYRDYADFYHSLEREDPIRFFLRQLAFSKIGAPQNMDIKTEYEWYINKFPEDGPSVS